MALNNFRSVNLKIDKANDYFISNQFAKEGDYNGRKLVVQLTNGGLIQDQTGVALNLGWQHQKVGNKGLDPFVIIDATQGIFEISYPAEMMRIGNVIAVIQVIESGKIVETRNFTIQVEASPIDEDAIVSENSFTVLQEALLTVNKYDGRIQNLENTKATKEEVANLESEVAAQLAQTDIDIKQNIQEDLIRQNVEIISVDNSDKQKHLFDPYKNYKFVKDWNPSDSSDKVFAPAIAKHNGILYAVWRSGSNHVSNDGKIKMRKSTDNGLTWDASDTIILANTADSFIYNMNFITTSNGNFIIVFFDRNSNQKVTTKYISSTNQGVSWTTPKVLPTPPGVAETALCGAHTIKNGVIYQTGYTLDNKVYIIKSNDNGINWEFLNYVSHTVKINESSITYIPSKNKFYLIARSAEQKDGVEPYADYENFLIIAESYDAINWGNFHEIPIYGHAPWSSLLQDDKIIVSYANRSRKYNDKKYSCDVVIIQDGEPITNSIRLNTSINGDSYYSAIINDGTNVHLVYYQDQTSLRYHRFLSAELNGMVKNNYYIPNTFDNTNYLNGQYQTKEGFGFQWQEEAFDLNLTSYTVKDFVLKKPMSVRGFFAGATIYSSDNSKMTILQNVWVEAKLKDATTVQVILRNMSGSNITLTDVKLKIFAIGQ